MIRKLTLIGAALTLAVGVGACGAVEQSDGTPTAAKTGTTAAKTATPKAKAKPARPKAKTLDTAKASGDYAIAMASGTASGKAPIRVQVTTPSGVGASVNWTMTCSQGLGSAGSKSGDTNVTGSKTLRLAKPSKDSTDCIVAASAQLDGSGNLRVRITG